MPTPKRLQSGFGEGTRERDSVTTVSMTRALRRNRTLTAHGSKLSDDAAWCRIAMTIDGARAMGS